MRTGVEEVASRVDRVRGADGAREVGDVSAQLGVADAAAQPASVPVEQRGDDGLGASEAESARSVQAEDAGGARRGRAFGVQRELHRLPQP